MVQGSGLEEWCAELRARGLEQRRAQSAGRPGEEPDGAAKFRPAQRSASSSGDAPACPAACAPLKRIAREGSRGVARAKRQPVQQSASRSSEVPGGPAKCVGVTAFAAGRCMLHFRVGVSGLRQRGSHCAGLGAAAILRATGRARRLTISRSTPSRLRRRLRQNTKEKLRDAYKAIANRYTKCF